MPLEAEVSTFVPLLDPGQAARLPLRAREVVEYRKSGLSLNHIQGCPLDCAYCVRCKQQRRQRHHQNSSPDHDSILSSGFLPLSCAHLVSIYIERDLIASA